MGLALLAILDTTRKQLTDKKGQENENEREKEEDGENTESVHSQMLVK